MANKFFKVPFAINGDKQAIPDEKNSEGFVSFNEGWGGDYERDLRTDTNAKPVGRKEMNGILNAITVAIRQYQTTGFPEFITAADNGGSPFVYSLGAVVSYNNKLYVSVISNNNTIPGSDELKWQTFIYKRASAAEAIAGVNGDLVITPPTLKESIDYSFEQYQGSLEPFLLPIGFIGIFAGSEAPAGWLELNGQTFDKIKNPKLAKILPSGRVPDYRGQFVRAWAHGSSVDPDSNRAIGSLQGDAIRNIKGMTGGAAYMPNAGLSGPFYEVRPRQGTAYQSTNDSSSQNLGFDASRAVPTATENRPTNIAAMYIIKTDLAESEEGAAVPSAIVVSPLSASINAGTTQQFTAIVLPASLAANFPVSWSVSDPALGSISNTGLYNAIAGKSGVQTIIASISTGLTSLATVNQFIYLTSIALDVIPDITVGDDYELKLTLSPSNATESLNYSTSDSQIASVQSGVLFGTGAGTATITATGSLSGVSASRQVKVLAAEVVDEFFRIENNLSEITDASEARENLELGELATKDSLTAGDVGAVPIADVAIVAGTNLNSMTAPGEHFQNVTSNATLPLNYPVAVAGVLKVYRTGVDEIGCRQVYMPYNSTAEYRRYAYGVPLAFSNWSAAGGSGAFAEVGSFAFCKHRDSSTQHNISPGSQWAGSDLKYAGTIVSIGSPLPPGTWIACGGATNTGEATVFQRIA
ncbi:Ig-like domain-containing protein [Yersinia pekkanenii]|uniref:Ig-like domain-containing protein n=1 Tax=Yersinia pekkanenii TaxID=1288385 RepID=A0A0T9R7K0_9GAMM|nr:tail fiber protein [Yersinia pekkanenii]CNI48701.1 Ig-like domain-containing protein [Yersinia pekkanenii]